MKKSSNFFKAAGLALFISSAFYPGSSFSQQLDFPHDSYEGQNRIDRSYGGTAQNIYNQEDSFERKNSLHRFQDRPDNSYGSYGPYDSVYSNYPTSSTNYGGNRGNGYQRQGQYSQDNPYGSYGGPYNSNNNMRGN